MIKRLVSRHPGKIISQKEARQGKRDAGARFPQGAQNGRNPGVSEAPAEAEDAFSPLVFAFARFAGGKHDEVSREALSVNVPGIQGLSAEQDERLGAVGDAFQLAGGRSGITFNPAELTLKA